MLDEGLSDELSRHLTVYPGLSHLMTDIAVTRCYDDECCMDFLTSNHAMLFSAWIILDLNSCRNIKQRKAEQGVRILQ